MSVSVSFPDDLLVATHEDRERFPRKVMILTLGHLFDEGRISSGVAAHLLGCSRLEFYRLLTEHGFSVINYAADELAAEAESSRHIATQRTVCP